MSIFGTILDKIFHHAQPATGTQPKPQAASQVQPSQPQVSPTAKTPVAQPVNVEKVLTDLAGKKGGGGNWRTSIVDLLKLLDLDSSLNARKELGQELGVHVGADGSAEQNIALQKAVWKKLAENGGQVPASLKD